MLEYGFGLIVLLVVIAVIVEVVQSRRNVTIDLPWLQQSFASVEQSQQALAQSVREEFAKNREDAAAVAKELAKSLKSAADDVDRVRTAVEEKLKAAQDDNAQKLQQLKEESLASAKSLREEIERSLKGFQESLAKSVGDAGQTQKAQSEALAAKFAEAATVTGQKIDGVKAAVEAGLKAVQGDSAKQLEQTRTALQEKLQVTEKRLGESFQQVSGRVDQVSKEIQTVAANLGNIGKP